LSMRSPVLPVKFQIEMTDAVAQGRSGIGEETMGICMIRSAAWFKTRQPDIAPTFAGRIRRRPVPR